MSDPTRSIPPIRGLRWLRARAEALGAGVVGCLMRRASEAAQWITSDSRTQSSKVVTPGRWVPSVYFAEGVPFAMVIWVTGTMFKDLGHSDAEITLAIGTIAIAWSA